MAAYSEELWREAFSAVENQFEVQNLLPEQKILPEPETQGKDQLREFLGQEL
jgi:hypothetical protein